MVNKTYKGMVLVRKINQILEVNKYRIVIMIMNQIFSFELTNGLFE